MKCYKVKDRTNFKAEVDLAALQSEFGLEHCRLKGKAKLFCVPVDTTVTKIRYKRNHGAPAAAYSGPEYTNDRICYEIECPSPEIPEVEASDQFGTRELKEFEPVLLCTPAVKGIPTTTTSTTTTTTTSTTTTTTTTVPTCIDADGDGYGAGCPAGPDCNDADPNVNPAAPEVCDGIDNNCNGLIDEEGAVGCTSFYLDNDGDGFGQSGSSKCLCAPAGGYTATLGGDCNDANPNINPAAPEVCDGIDNNCNGLIDEKASGCGPNMMCIGGLCACNEGFADCNTNAADGCETAILTDPGNCGGCGNVCPAPSTCSGGVCF
ncbi:MAG: hypothetical protein D6815_01175 [Candidatus Dadabacteria bacterium]|nr:MAG: hypothetical protein D6815_01175 [Candidatus Dadabacteria bacterium]